jgi:putative addiction module antidote
MKVEAKRIGNSTGFVIPREVVVRLGIEQGKMFSLTEMADGGLRIAPYDPEFDKAMEIARMGMKRYRNALAELAK